MMQNISQKSRVSVWDFCDLQLRERGELAFSKFSMWVVQIPRSRFCQCIVEAARTAPEPASLPVLKPDRLAQSVDDTLHAALEVRGRPCLARRLGQHNPAQHRALQVRRHRLHGLDDRLGAAPRSPTPGVPRSRRRRRRAPSPMPRSHPATRPARPRPPSASPQPPAAPRCLARALPAAGLHSMAPAPVVLPLTPAGSASCCRSGGHGHSGSWWRGWRAPRWPAPGAPGRRGPARG